jgi:perosamine synthetase
MKQLRNYIPLAMPHVTEDEVSAVGEVVRSGWWTTGPKVTEFEDAVRNYLGGDLHAVALNSCTAGLYLALKALGIGAGDEVIVPTWTFAATSLAVEWAGAVPVLCDICPETLSIDPGRVREHIGPRTRAIIPVHIAGYPCDMEKMQEIAERHGLYLIEDAAHAFGTMYNGKKIGSFGFAGVFSFYATKNIACGEGGMLVTSDRHLSEKVRKLSYFGIDKMAYKKYEGRDTWYYEIDEAGYKFNMDSMHAALGLVQLRKVDSMNCRRREIAGIYRNHLKGLHFFDHDPLHYHTYHLFQVVLPDGIARDEVIRKLKEQSIQSSVHYIPLHMHPHYSSCYPASDFPSASALSAKVLSLPMYPSLSDEDVFYICENLNSIMESLLC